MNVDTIVFADLSGMEMLLAICEVIYHGENVFIA